MKTLRFMALSSAIRMLSGYEEARAALVGMCLELLLGRGVGLLVGIDDDEVFVERVGSFGDEIDESDE